MRTTSEHFNLTNDELLVKNNNGYTKEDNLIFDSGEKVLLYANIERFKQYRDTIKEEINRRRYYSKTILETTGGTIAVILK